MCVCDISSVCESTAVLTVGLSDTRITAREYAQRRSKLANKLPKNAIAVVAANEVKYRASGIFNEYRQDSNFFYLTGMSFLWYCEKWG